MARAEFTLQHIVTSGLVDPAGAVASQVNGGQFGNDGESFLRVVNAGSNANAVATISLGAATPSGGTYALEIMVKGVLYTTAAIAFGALKATIATAVLAAKSPNGSALSADYTAGTCVGGGTDLPTGPATLTFGGAGVNGLAATPIVVTVDNTAVTGGSYAAQMTTPGTGTAQIIFETTQLQQGLPVVFKENVPVGTYWYGPFSPAVFNNLATNEVNVDFDAQAANLTVTAFHIG